ncbi:hypothetical protein [Zunongwangia sp.]|uniref:hypothetical protein n=1 Tax=Zunongwangia sp. TaxID=1965325 RepID=UPI003AA89772
MMEDYKEVFEKNSFFNGALIVLGIFGIIRVGLAFFIESNSINLLYPSILITFVIILFFNTKWIYKVIIKETEIEYFYPINLLGRKKLTINFGEIDGMSFHGYAYNSPSHFKLKSAKGKFRFNCPEDMSKKLIEFFRSKGITVTYKDEKEVGYRK